MPTYMQHCFWNWHLHDPEHLLFQHSPAAPTCVGLKTQPQCTSMMKVSLTIPANIEFQAPPVTPVNTTMGYIRLPILLLPPKCPLTQGPTYYSTLQKQFCVGLLPWQCALFGMLHKANSTNTLQHFLQSKTPVMIVSNASVQKSGQSGFSQLIAHKHTLVWQGTSLAPGPEADTYLGHAEAYGLLAAITFLACLLFGMLQHTGTPSDDKMLL